MTLKTIPRASKILATDADIGSSSAISVTQYYSGFTHSIKYKFGNLSGYLLKDGTTTSTETKFNNTNFNFQIPDIFYAQIPNNDEGTCTLTIKTYSGSTLIGTEQQTTFKAKVPTSSKPVIESATAVDVNSKTLALTGDSTRLVKYFSDVKVNVKGKCLNYAGFSKLRENNVIDIPATTSASNGTTTVTGEKIFEKSTNTQYKIVLVDTRQLPSDYKVLSEANGSFKLIPYLPLTMSLDAKRLGPTSNSAKINFTGIFYNGYYDEAKKNFNTLTIKWRYKLRDSGSWITTGADDTTNGWHNLTLGTDFKYNENEDKYSSINDIVIEDIFDYQENYTIEIMYQDRLSSYTTQQPILEGIPNHDYGKDANGNNYFNVNGTIYTNNKSILEFIYPVGSIYMSVNNVNPKTLFGGEWQTWGTGRAPVGVDTSQTEFATVEKTGGNKNMQKHNHTTTVTTNGDHNHAILARANNGSYSPQIESYSTGDGSRTCYTNNAGSHSHTVTVAEAGTGTSGNLQPYITCYMWKRTA